MRYFKNIKKSIEKHRHIILFIFIVLSVIRLCIIFSHRNGHHIDEAWSYGFANSYYHPHFYTEEMSGRPSDRNDLVNVGYWISGEDFKEYLTVSPDERFSYDSVIYNRSEDDGPPLFELLLHTVCSLFPGTFSWYYAFSINVILFIGTLILLFLISHDILHDAFGAFVCVTYFVMSGCGTGGFLYLRIYPLFTFLTVVLTYVISKLITKNKIRFADQLVLFAVTLVGCFSHFYFLLIAFLFTVTVSFYFLIKKNYLSLCRLCYTMLISVLVFFTIRPFSMSRMIPILMGGDPLAGHIYAYSWQLSLSNMHFFKDTLGFYIDFMVPMLMEIIGVLLFVLSILCLFMFLFRNEKWMPSLKSKTIYWLKKLAGFLKLLFKESGPVSVIMIVVSVLYMFVVPKTASLVHMGFIDRYFFAAMTIFVIAFVLIAVVLSNFMSKTYNHSGIFVYVILFILVMNTNTFTDFFKFEYMNDAEMTETLNEKDCVVLICSESDITWLSPILYSSDDVYIEFAKNIIDEKYVFPDIAPDCLVLVNSGRFLSEENISQMEEKGSFEVEGDVSRDLLLTFNDYLELLESRTGYDYEVVGDYEMKYKLLECVKSDES